MLSTTRATGARGAQLGVDGRGDGRTGVAAGRRLVRTRHTRPEGCMRFAVFLLLQSRESCRGGRTCSSLARGNCPDCSSHRLDVQGENCGRVSKSDQARWGNATVGVLHRQRRRLRRIRTRGCAGQRRIRVQYVWLRRYDRPATASLPNVRGRAVGALAVEPVQNRPHRSPLAARLKNASASRCQRPRTSEVELCHVSAKARQLRGLIDGDQLATEITVDVRGGHLTRD